MDDYLVFENQTTAPATHAMVIGVGDYPHLNDGADSLTKWHDGMGQLSSPPASARAFADWLISTYHLPGCGLASVALLLSDPDGQEYTPPGGSTVTVEPATMAHVEKAVEAWHARGDARTENTLIFYFCGHGAVSGTEVSLLLRDFGARDTAPLKGAVDFRGLHLGMDKCEARKQLYFVDACRVATSAVLDAYNYAGEPIIYGSRRPGNSRRAPVFYATLSGSSAYGRANRPSQYTEALLKALAGAADNADDEDIWRVDTHNLNRGIDFLLKRAAERGAGLAQVNSVDNLSVFDFHELKDAPQVPVVVGCRPENVNKDAELTCHDGTAGTQVGLGDEFGWDIDLTPGSYSFSATVIQDPDRNGTKQRDIRPPYRRVKVEVTP